MTGVCLVNHFPFKIFLITLYQKRLNIYLFISSKHCSLIFQRWILLSTGFVQISVNVSSEIKSRVIIARHHSLPAAGSGSGRLGAALPWAQVVAFLGCLSGGVPVGAIVCVPASGSTASLGLKDNEIDKLRLSIAKDKHEH